MALFKNTFIASGHFVKFVDKFIIIIVSTSLLMSLVPARIIITDSFVLIVGASWVLASFYISRLV